MPDNDWSVPASDLITMYSENVVAMKIMINTIWFFLSKVIRDSPIVFTSSPSCYSFYYASRVRDWET